MIPTVATSEDDAGSTPGRRTPKVVWQDEHWMRTRGGISRLTENRSRNPQPVQVTVKDDGDTADCWLILDRQGEASLHPPLGPERSWSQQ